MMMMSELISEMLMLNKLVNMVSGQHGSAYKVKVFKVSRQRGSAYKLSRYYQGSKGLCSLFFLSLLVFFFFFFLSELMQVVQDKKDRSKA